MNVHSIEANATASPHFIEHIIEPTKLLLVWQSSNEQHRKRYVVAEIHRSDDDKYTLMYLVNSKDFIEAQKYGFEYYPAFKEIYKIHDNVLDAFMRRLPPKTRGDYSKYLEGLRLKPDVELTDFAMLGYSGAKLLSDEFSIIHPFNDVEGPCELLIEVAGYRHRIEKIKASPTLNSHAAFERSYFGEEDSIEIIVNGDYIGCVTRALIPTFQNWLDDNRIKDAFVEKTNGTATKPTLYLFVQITPK